MSLTRKRKKELRRLQHDATELWEHQQQLVGHAANVAREASRQLGNVGREQVLPAVQETYNRHFAPSINRGVKAGREAMDKKVLPAVGGVLGTAMSAWDAANAKRQGLSFTREPAAPVKRGPGIGSIVAIVLGVAAAAGVLYAAWQALRTDDELWVADDPLSAPEA
ncbi:DNA helicase [Microbacterium sp.]|uniref:DNA helicase n=1 Tax=Microbacterium sp. TaxID=51671 RepID=UPI0026211B0A|nr:DNA helicase [Microbacterium sp.]